MEVTRIMNASTQRGPFQAKLSTGLVTFSIKRSSFARFFICSLRFVFCYCENY